MRVTLRIIFTAEQYCQKRNKYGIKGIKYRTPCFGLQSKADLTADIHFKTAFLVLGLHKLPGRRS